MVRPVPETQSASLSPIAEPEMQQVEPDTGTWIWVRGYRIFFTYPSSLPHIYLQMNHPGFFVQCKDLQFQFDDSHYSFILSGYWQIYDPAYGTLSGSKYFVISNGWLKGKLDQLEDVFNPNRYVAQCRYY
jgi:hypothetical protein